MSYSVYKHTFPNGKVYIGITSTKPMRRWDYGRGYKSQPLMKRAIDKYGWENISHEILFNKLTKEKAEQIEIELISKYKSNNPMFGYNVENGGNSVGKISDEQKRLMSEIMKNKYLCGKKNWMYGKRHSEETKKKISESRRIAGGHPHTEQSKRKLSETHKGEKNPMYGKCFSEEHRRKMGEAHKGEKNINYGRIFSEEHRRKIGEANGKTVRCIETNIVYYSVRNASIQTGIDKTGIHKCCHGKQKTSGGYHWEYVC